MDGRDIGSVVFADAPLKLYLIADPDARIARRARERTGGEAEVETSLATRDARDAEVNPFEPPPGAVALDTAFLGVRETFQAALDLVRLHAPELIP